MRILSYIFLLLVIILGISFAIINSESVAIHYYVGAKQLPLSLLLVLTFALGCIIGLCMGLFMMIKTKAKNFSLRQKLKATETEVLNLKTKYNIPT